MRSNVKALGEAIVDFVSRSLKVFNDGLTPRLGTMEARIAALEARPQMRYVGVWREGTEGKAGDVATHDGSMWYCWTPTTDRPGTSNAWQLAVKRGRDAR